MPETRTVSLSREGASYVDRLVAEGRFASGAEVVEAGLHALQNHDEQLERWLREEVVPAAEAMRADPSRGIPATEVRKQLLG